MVGGSACRNDVSMDGKGRGQASDRATLETTTAMAEQPWQTSLEEPQFFHQQVHD